MKEIREFLRLTRGIKKRRGLVALVYFINIIRLTGMMFQPVIFSYFIIDKVIKDGERHLLLPMIFLSAGLALMSFIMDILIGVLLRYLYINSTLDTRDFITGHLRKITIYDIEKESPAKFQMLLGEDTHVISSFFNFVVLEIFSQVYMILFGICALFFMDKFLGLAGILIIFFLIGIPTLIKKPIAHHLDRVRTHREDIGQILFETVEGSREIKTLGLEKWENEKNQKIYKGLIRSSVLDSFFQAISSETTRLIIMLILVAVYWVGANLIFKDSLTIGLLVLSVMYMEQTLQRLQTINQKYGDYQGANVSAKRITDFLKISPEHHYTVTVPVNPSPGTAPIVETRNLSLSLNDVSILSNVTLHIPRGKKVALVGLSGSGKTSFYKMLLGFIPLQQGEILIDGISIKDFSRYDLNNWLGCVSQAPFLFKGTLYENILLGDLNANREEVYEAALKANLKSLIDKSPAGLDMELSNKGLQLSGGERQRIVIARMFLKKPRVLLLDEPTSALDRVTEREVIEALDKLMQGQTTIVSTHRLETIRNADLIYVMEDGKITASGTHDKLLEISASYGYMVKLFEEEKNGKN